MQETTNGNQKLVRKNTFLATLLMNITLLLFIIGLGLFSYWLIQIQYNPIDPVIDLIMGLVPPSYSSAVNPDFLLEVSVWTTRGLILVILGFSLILMIYYMMRASFQAMSVFRATNKFFAKVFPLVSLYPLLYFLSFIPNGSTTPATPPNTDLYILMFAAIFVISLVGWIILLLSKKQSFGMNLFKFASVFLVNAGIAYTYMGLQYATVSMPTQPFEFITTENIMYAILAIHGLVFILGMIATCLKRKKIYKSYSGDVDIDDK